MRWTNWMAAGAVALCQVGNGQVITSTGEFDANGQSFSVGSLSEQIDLIQTQTSVNPIERRRYSNSIIEIRSIDEPVVNDNVYGTLDRGTFQGGQRLVANRASNPFPPFPRLGMEMFFATPVIEFGFFSWTTDGNEPRTIRFFDVGDTLLHQFEFNQISNSDLDQLAAFRSVDNPIARVEFEEVNPDGVGVPIILRDFHVVVPAPGTSLLAVAVGLAACRRRR